MNIWGKIRSDDDQTFTLAHLIRPKPQGADAAQKGAKARNEFVAVFSRKTAELEGKRDMTSEILATEERVGQLRLIRTGSELIFLVAEGEYGSFQELLRTDVSTDAMMALRLSATTSDVDSGLTLRLHDLRIRASQLPGAAPPKKKSRTWLVFLLAAVAFMGGGGFLLWRYGPWRP